LREKSFVQPAAAKFATPTNFVHRRSVASDHRMFSFAQGSSSDVFEVGQVSDLISENASREE
jgi:hypothetical protein